MREISRGTLKFLYQQLYRIRAVELEIEKLYPADEMKTPVHLCIGQEAIAVGICANLKKEDYCFSNHRGHGHYLAKGGDLKAMIAELYGRETGCSRGRGGSMHLVDTAVGLLGSSSIVSGGIPIAVGAALAAVLKKEKRVSTVFFGDAACEEGVLYESFNFAKLKNLPLIFVCENNFYSVCSPLSHRQPDDRIYLRSKGFSLPGYRVDGTDVLKVYRLAAKLIQGVRSGKGPVFLECIAYRWRGHAGAGSDVHLGHRTQKELEQWLFKCPLEKLERFLMKNKVFKLEEIGVIREEVNKEIEEAFNFAKASPLPNPEELEHYVYKE